MVQITAARVMVGDRVAATVDLVDVGGGTQVVNVDGTLEERLHPLSTVYHVRLLSPDRMVPDELRQVNTYEEATHLAELYGKRLAEHADRVASLAADLKV